MRLYKGTSVLIVRVSKAHVGKLRLLHTVPDAFMVSLAHCHNKRGSGKAEHADVK